MASAKVFVVVEAVDRPAGAMLVRYQTVDRIEPDPEETRIAASETERALKEIPEELREGLKIQVAAAKSMMAPKQVIYRTDEKVAICTKAEEVSAAIVEAKEQYDEIRRLQKSGARFDISGPRMGTF